MLKVTFPSLRLAHAVLRKDLQALERAAQSLTETDRLSLVARLELMQARLAEHFRLEEENGYFEHVLQLAPQMDRAVERLASEHNRLAQTLSELCEAAKSASNTKSLQQSICDWIRQVRAHEASENALVQEAFNRDEAAQD